MKSDARYSAYDRFAWVYSRDWGSEYHARARPVFEHHILTRLVPGDRVLDLCCGTGDLSRFLVDSGMKVTGIDGSEEMLKYARERVPEAEFLARDARAFHFPPQFDAVISTFDSLNHVITLAELEQVFRNAFDALSPGGFFVFDLNMEESFRTLWHGSSVSVADQEVWIMRGSYDEQDKLGRAEVTMFRKEAHWERSDVTVLERCYSETEVHCGLERAGFVDIVKSDAYELGMTGDMALGRSYFFATKP